MYTRQPSSSSTPQTLQPAQQNSITQVDIAVANTVAGLLVIIVPSCLILGTFLYKKYYRAYRAAVLLRQIETLEKLWQISPKK